MGCYPIKNFLHILKMVCSSFFHLKVHRFEIQRRLYYLSAAPNSKMEQVSLQILTKREERVRSNSYFHLPQLESVSQPESKQKKKIKK